MSGNPFDCHPSGNGGGKLPARLFPKCKATYSGIPTGEYCEVCNSPMIKVGDTVRCNSERCKTNEGLLKKEDK